MRSFSKLVNNLESKKFYKVQTKLDLVLRANDIKEASFLAEESTQSFNEKSDFQILKVQEVTKNEYNELLVNEKISLTGDRILNSWNKFFGDNNPSILEKMEFYHLMRIRGFESSTIQSALEGKI
jgi:hypothetical protein